MIRLRMVIASALLALAALVTPAAAAVSDTTQAQDVGWGLATTGEEPETEPDAASLTPTEYPAGDVGWG
ncbi:hypothetical protein [Streptomyces sp. SudanB91_2054]|uniref:hypothetical protein n=1 Tax=Streptomyces sp. SudanB91_2054 TaxID=3035278 RepID=UPI0036DC14BF